MKEYAVYKGRPVETVGPLYVTLRDKDGKPVGQGEFLGLDVRLPFGHRVYAQPSDLEPINKSEYDRMVKAEEKEREELSRKQGFSCEFLALKKHGTNAAQERGR